MVSIKPDSAYTTGTTNQKEVGSIGNSKCGCSATKWHSFGSKCDPSQVHKENRISVASNPQASDDTSAKFKSAFVAHCHCAFHSALISGGNYTSQLLLHRRRSRLESLSIISSLSEDQHSHQKRHPHEVGYGRHRRRELLTHRLFYQLRLTSKNNNSPIVQPQSRRTIRYVAPSCLRTQAQTPPTALLPGL